MATDDRVRRAEALIEEMRAARGYMYPEWEFAARQDPEFVAAYNRLYELSLGDGQHVSGKVREFVAIALLCFRVGSGRAWWPTCGGRSASVRLPPSSSRSWRPAWSRAEPPPSTAG